MSPIERSDSGNPPGFEINHTQITTTVNIVSTTEATGTTIISPGAITFDGAPVLCHFFGLVVIPTAPASGTDNVIVSLFEGATQITRLVTSASNVSVQTVTQSSINLSLSGFFRFTPTAASHTYTVTAHVNSTTGTPAIAAGSGGTGGNPPAFIRFTKV